MDGIKIDVYLNGYNTVCVCVCMHAVYKVTVVISWLKKRLLCLANQMTDKLSIQHFTSKESIDGKASNQFYMSPLHQSISSFDPSKKVSKWRPICSIILYNYNYDICVWSKPLSN